MPTSRELVSNKSLSGSELSRILLADFATLLEQHGLLTSQMAFGRIAYDLRLTMHLGNPSLPTTEDHLRSTPKSIQQVEAMPGLEALEPGLSLEGAENPILTADNLHREITSPNKARLEHGLPVSVTTMGEDGHNREEKIKYPSSYPGLDLQQTAPVLTDVTAEVRKELGLPEEEDVPRNPEQNL